MVCPSNDIFDQLFFGFFEAGEFIFEDGEKSIKKLIFHRKLAFLGKCLFALEETALVWILFLNKRDDKIFEYLLKLMSFIGLLFIIIFDLANLVILLQFVILFFYFIKLFLFLFFDFWLRLVQDYCFSLIQFLLFYLQLHFVLTFRVHYPFEGFSLGFTSLLWELMGSLLRNAVGGVWNAILVEIVADRRMGVWVV